MTVLLVFSAVLATLILKVNAINKTEIGSFDNAHFGNFIINGHSAHKVQFPWQIHIKGSTTKNPGIIFVCGGALITTTNALTAAHCCFGLNKFRVLVGRTNLSNKHYLRATNYCKSHERYDARTFQNDIAVLRFASIKMMSTIRPIVLPGGSERSKDFARLTATTSGWGRQLNGRPSNDLKYITVRVMTNGECRKSVQHVFDSTLCAKGDQIQSTCPGDSGGPLVYYTNTRPILIGITSFGSGVCTLGRPMGFTRVTKYLSWIHSHR